MTARKEVKRKRGRPGKTSTDEDEEDLKIMGIRTLDTLAKDQKEWWQTVLEAKVHNGTVVLERRRKSVQ